MSIRIGKYLVQVHEFMNIGQAERASCRRNGRRRVGAAEEPAEDREEVCKEFTWWRKSVSYSLEGEEYEVYY